MPVAAVIVGREAIHPSVDGHLAAKPEASAEMLRQKAQALMIGDKAGRCERGLRHVVLLESRPGQVAGREHWRPAEQAPGPRGRGIPQRASRARICRESPLRQVRAGPGCAQA